MDISGYGEVAVYCGTLMEARWTELARHLWVCPMGGSQEVRPAAHIVAIFGSPTVAKCTLTLRTITPMRRRLPTRYGQTTTLTYDASGSLTRVTEPGGRYLQFSYSQISGLNMLTEVDAYDGQGHEVDSVVYHYASKSTGGQL